MDDHNVNIEGVRFAPQHMEKPMTGQTRAKMIDDRIRVMLVFSGRYLMFFGEISVKDGAVSALPASNELTESDARDGRVRIIDGEKFIIGGFGGRAAIASKKSTVEVLATRVPGMFEATAMSNDGPTTVRKIGIRFSR